MRNIITIIFLFIHALFGISQSTYPKLINKVKESKSTIVRYTASSLVEKTDDGKYITKEFNMESGLVYVLATYKDESLKTLYGRYTERIDGGSIVNDGNYVDGIRVGKWVTMFNGNGFYVKGKKEGKWVVDDDEKRIVLNYVRDTVDGEYSITDKFSRKTDQTTFLMGINVGDYQLPRKELPRFSGCEEDEISLKLKEACAQKKALEFINSKLKLPKVVYADEGFEGTVLMKVKILSDGYLEEIISLRCHHEKLRNAVIKVISNMPDWIPGKWNDENVDGYYIIPLKIKIVDAVDGVDSQK
jgi:hypothetical protein